MRPRWTQIDPMVGYALSGSNLSAREPAPSSVDTTAVGGLKERLDMEFSGTDIPGVFIVRPQTHTDERGFFARTWCHDEVAAAGLNPALAQCSISFNPQDGTLRGMHLQSPPDAEAKLVRCTMGAIFDVALDLRPSSPAYLRHVGVELTADNRCALYIPEGCAHGFLTLVADSEVYYQISTPYAPQSARGVRWNDSAFGIAWPAPAQIISARDRDYPDRKSVV